MGSEMCIRDRALTTALALSACTPPHEKEGAEREDTATTGPATPSIQSTEEAASESESAESNESTGSTEYNGATEASDAEGSEAAAATEEAQMGGVGNGTASATGATN